VRRLDLASAARVLDVGAGTGALTPALRAAAPHAAIISVDPAWAMLRFARARRDVTPALADAAALPVADATVDAVLLAYVLFMLADPARGVREATRVLRTGGRVGTVTWASEEQSLAAKTWDATLDELGVPALPAHSNHTGLDTAESVGTFLAAAGLVRGDVWQETIDYTFEPDRFWRLRTSHGVNGLRLARLGAARRERVLAELHDRLSALAPCDYQFRGTLVCAVGYKANGGKR
jgi:SAM-dependent methyltransferase